MESPSTTILVRALMIVNIGHLRECGQAVSNITSRRLTSTQAKLRDLPGKPSAGTSICSAKSSALCDVGTHSLQICCTPGHEPSARPLPLRAHLTADIQIKRPLARQSEGRSRPRESIVCTRVGEVSRAAEKYRLSKSAQESGEKVRARAAAGNQQFVARSHFT